MITLATLHEATAQQVFDQVARHLLTQGQKSNDERGCVRPLMALNVLLVASLVKMSIKKTSRPRVGLF